MNRSSFPSGLRRTVMACCIAAAVAGCASAPKPAVPDGTARTPVNDPARIASLRAAALGARTDVDTRVRQADEIATLRGEVAQLKDALHNLLFGKGVQPGVTPSARPASPAPVIPSLSPQAVPGAQSTTPPSPAASPLSAIPANGSGLQSSSASVGTNAPLAPQVFVMHFDAGQARLKRPIDQDLASMARQSPHVVLTAFTDSTGSPEVNQVVANARASNVGHALVQAGVASRSITLNVQPLSNYLASNQTAAGRALNRRVEVAVLPAASPIAQAASDEGVGQ